MRIRPIAGFATSSIAMKRSIRDLKPSHVPSNCIIAGTPYWVSSEEYPRMPLPTRDEQNCLSFPDHPSFRPNLTPQEVFQAGAFGGTYFRSITSKTANCSYPVGVHLELPPEWFENVLTVTSQVYSKDLNKYAVKSGNDLEFWENKGWMRPQDPYGWFQCKKNISKCRLNALERIIIPNLVF